MSEQAEPESSVPAESGAGDLRNKLVKRLAVAGVLVAILLGMLAFFDYLATPSEEGEDEGFTHPVPVPPKKAVSQPVKPVELPEPPAPPVPVVAEPPPPEIKVEVPAVDSEAKPDTRPSSARPTASASKAAAPIVPAKPAPAVGKPVTAVPEGSAAPSVAAPEQPAPAVASASTPAPTVSAQPKPSARVIESQPAPVVAPSGVSRLFSGFLVQAGVFTSPQRAEELHAKLTLSGVPSTLETRVQVGPFRTRQEAEVAQAKLKELGVESVLVPPKSPKR